MSSMLSAAVASWVRRTPVPPVGDLLVFPLTYDEQDSTGTISLDRSGPGYPYVTPAGFEGDGYEARYFTTALPSWANSGPLSLQASINVPNNRRRSSSREELVSVGTNDAAAVTRLGISLFGDATASGVPESAGVIGARVSAALVPLGRPGWNFVRPVPSPTIRGLKALPQAIIFLDDDTYMFSVHVEDTESVVYSARLSDGAITGTFSFGIGSYRHVATFARRSNGDMWASDYDTGRLLRIDVAASFASGAAVILEECRTPGLNGVGSIEFKTVAGVEYLFVQEYFTSEVTGGFLYVFPLSAIAPDIGPSSRYKRFDIGRRVQGIVAKGSTMLVSRNSQYGGTAYGWVEELNIDGMVTTLSDNARVGGGINLPYLLSARLGPSQYIEDLAVHPSNGDLFTLTEGWNSVGDIPGFLSVWSSKLTDAGVLSHYVIEHNGANTAKIRVNGYPFAEISAALGSTADVLSVGGLPGASPGFTSGFTLATVANVALSSGPIPPETSAQIASGAYETETLKVYTVSLTNPGAEAGSTTGWTSEVGGMTTRTANPLPYEGAYYFTGGSFVNSISRQRRTTASAGVPDSVVDTGQSWARARWRQAAYSNEDPGSMGLRALNASNVSLGQAYGPFIWTPFGSGAGGPWYWYPRNMGYALPANTRSLDTLYNASGRTNGTANDFYVDNISVTVYAR